MFDSRLKSFTSRDIFLGGGFITFMLPIEVLWEAFKVSWYGLPRLNETDLLDLADIMRGGLLLVLRRNLLLVFSVVDSYSFMAPYDFKGF